MLSVLSCRPRAIAPEYQLGCARRCLVHMHLRYIICENQPKAYERLKSKTDGY